MRQEKTRYIFVVGGVMSGIGKGITASSTAVILSEYGYKTNLMKIDPYLNVDAGTMNPTEHGEVFVLDTGLETDQDLGNYERFLGRSFYREDYITSGMVYQHVIDRERSLGYDGKCVETIPHLVDETRQRIELSARRSQADVQIVEIGGTLGDYQNLLFIEAGRQMQVEKPNHVIFALVSYLPCPNSIGEAKTRPTQNAIRTLNSYGVVPSLVIARSEGKIDNRRKEKIARSSNLQKKHIIAATDVACIYDIITNLEKEKIGEKLINLLCLPKQRRTNTLRKWRQLQKNVKNKKFPEVRIAIVGKYFATGSYILKDSYISILEAMRFSGVSEGVRVVPELIDTKDFEGRDGDYALRHLEKFDGIIIPGGFGNTGVPGKLNVIRFAREHDIPILGICYGLQLMVVEYMQNVVGKKTANSTEVDPRTPHPVIHILEEQKEKMNQKQYGASMRLGLYTATLMRPRILHDLYGTRTIQERHRHRYEVNGAYVKEFTKKGLLVSATSKKGLVEAIELDTTKHPFFVGTQYHPEFTARPFDPNPVFCGLIYAAGERAAKRK